MDKNNNLEIERKFLLQAAPKNMESVSGEVIMQGYVVGDGIVRLRKKGEKYLMTVKSKRTADGLSRQEWEVEIPEFVFTLIWPHKIGRSIRKVRYSVPYHDYILEVDIFKGGLAGLILVECEFPDEASARKFVLPESLGEAVEVTADKRFGNRHLAMHGLPPEL